METRVEKDSLGDRLIPKDAYYGVQTHRALENFPIVNTIYIVVITLASALSLYGVLTWKKWGFNLFLFIYTIMNTNYYLCLVAVHGSRSLRGYPPI